MIDSHCHLDLAAFSNDWTDELQRAKKAGVTRLLVPGTQSGQWQQQQQLAKGASSIIPIDIALGAHPYFLHHDEDEKALVRQLDVAFEEAVIAPVAVGEIGLDSHIDVPIETQKRCLQVQLNFAQQRQLPVILHHRKSHHRLLEALTKVNRHYGGVVHAFSGSIEVAKAYIHKGLYLGIGGTVTYPRASKTRDTLAYLLHHFPGHLLLETDAPDMPMFGRQGKRNSPAYLLDVVKTMAALSEHSEQEIISFTTANYNRCFKGVE